MMFSKMRNEKESDSGFEKVFFRWWQRRYMKIQNETKILTLLKNKSFTIFEEWYRGKNGEYGHRSRYLSHAKGGVFKSSAWCQYLILRFEDLLA